MIHNHPPRTKGDSVSLPLPLQDNPVPKILHNNTKTMNEEFISTSPKDKRPEISIISHTLHPPTRSVTSKDLASVRISQPIRSQTSPAVLEVQAQNEPDNEKSYWRCLKSQCGKIYDRLQYADKPRCPQCNTKKIKPPENYDKMILYQCSIVGCAYREKVVINSPELSCLHPAPAKNPPTCGGWMVPVWEDDWKGFKSRVKLRDSVRLSEES